jgi:hypothetical protein
VAMLPSPACVVVVKTCCHSADVGKKHEVLIKTVCLLLLPLLKLTQILVASTLL